MPKHRNATTIGLDADARNEMILVNDSRYWDAVYYVRAAQNLEHLAYSQTQIIPRSALDTAIRAQGVWVDAIEALLRLWGLQND